MFLIHINDIFYVCTIYYDTLYTSCIDKMTIYNIDKDNLVYNWYRKLYKYGIDKSSFVYIAYGNFVYT